MGSQSKEQRAKRKSLKGIVVSNKMKDTAVVKINREIIHPLYRKLIRKRSKVKVHDKGNKCRIGDFVLIEETRPLSKTKNWRLIKVLEQVK